MIYKLRCMHFKNKYVFIFQSQQILSNPAQLILHTLEEEMFSAQYNIGMKSPFHSNMPQQSMIFAQCLLLLALILLTWVSHCLGWSDGVRQVCLTSRLPPAQFIALNSPLLPFTVYLRTDTIIHHAALGSQLLLQWCWLLIPEEKDVCLTVPSSSPVWMFCIYWLGCAIYYYKL